MEEGMTHMNAKEVELNDKEGSTKESDGKLSVEIQLGNMSFDIAGTETDIDEEERNFEFHTNFDESENKIEKTSVEASLIKEEKGNSEFIGETFSPWQGNIQNRLQDTNLQHVKFQENLPIKCDNKVKANVAVTNDIYNGENMCNESRINQVPSLKLDSTGNIEAFKEIEDQIDEKDVFFVVGSSRYPNLESLSNALNKEKEFLKYPFHLNTDHFKNVKGKIVKDFTIVKNACANLPVHPKEEEKPLKRCPHMSACENIFGKIGDEKDEKSSDSSEIDEDSDYKVNEYPDQMSARRKCLISTKRRCPCRPIDLSSDSDENKQTKVYRQLSDCFLASQLLKETNNRKKPFPSIQARRCESCCADLTYQPFGKPCSKCGFKPTGKKLTNAKSLENIAQQWDDEEKRFIQQQGFSKYDHCTCKEESKALCIFCAINQMRQQNNNLKFNEYVKEADKEARTEVDQVCNEVLSKHYPPVERDEHGFIIKRPPEDVPRLSKMLEWLKSKCSDATKRRLECMTEVKMQRLQGGADKLNKKVLRPRRETKENKNVVNRGNNKSTMSKKKSNPGMLKLTRVSSAKGKENDKLARTSNDTKRLLKMKFDETVEQSGGECDEFKPDWVLDDIRDKKLKAAIQKLCRFSPADEWRKKEPKPLTKAEYLKKMMRKFGRKYAYSKNVRPVYASERHRHCLKIEKLVPRKMGWMWNLDTTLVQKGWRPGKLKKSIRELMEYFLREFPVDNLPTTKEMKARRKLFVEPPEDLTEKPTLQIRKQDGQYLITMNPLKDAKALQTSANPYANTKPIQFRITKSPTEIKRRQVKHCLKEAGFGKCTCEQPISGCKCRSFMEKERLEKTVHYLSDMLHIHNLADIVYLSDTTDSDSQMNLEITPPAGKVKHHLRGRTLESQATQYNEHDISRKCPVRTIEEINAERIQKMSQRQMCRGVSPTLPCQPKIEENKPKKRQSRVIFETKPRESLEVDEEDSYPAKRDQTTIPVQEPLNYTLNKDKPRNAIKGLKKAIGKPEKRARGGADIPPEGKGLTRASKKLSDAPFRTLLKPSLSEEFEPPRVTQPVNRWERFRRRRPVRPPWDDSIYIPPPLKTPPKENDRDNKKLTSPCRRTQSSGQNCQSKFHKNIRNQNLYRFGLKKDKACNTENLVEEEKNDTSAVGAKKSTYHQHCIRPVSAPAKPARSKPITVIR